MFGLTNLHPSDVGFQNVQIAIDRTTAYLAKYH